MVETSVIDFSPRWKAKHRSMRQNDAKNPCPISKDTRLARQISIYRGTEYQNVETQDYQNEAGWSSPSIDRVFWSKLLTVIGFSKILASIRCQIQTERVFWAPSVASAVIDVRWGVDFFGVK